MRMSQFTCYATNQPVIFAIDLFLESRNQLFDFWIGRGEIVINRQELPLPFNNAVSIVIYYNIETSNLIGAYSGLCNQNVVNFGWLF